MQRKEFLRQLGAVAGGTLLGPLVTACGGGGDPVATTGATSAPTTAAGTTPSVPTDATLSADEIAALKYMREEEKLAHDVYATLYLSWGAQVFGNIAVSETEHTEAVRARLVAYGLDDPAAGKDIGEFENAELRTMYQALVTAGAASLVEALKVGCLIEETDIRDIEARQAVTDETDILRVYDHLLCGSRNHLRAFDAALREQGVSYVAQVITQQEWDALAASPRERCTG